LSDCGGSLDQRYRRAQGRDAAPLATSYLTADRPAAHYPPRRPSLLPRWQAVLALISLGYLAAWATSGWWLPSLQDQCIQAWQVIAR
jgi:hypothetical protein